MSLAMEPLAVPPACRPDIEHLYRAVADGEPQREIMQMIYDLFGDSCELRPPVSELNLARRCGSARGAVRG